MGYMELLYGYSLMFSNMQTNQEDSKEQILNEFEATKKMPRKMKKRKRKSLQIRWNIANYELF